jgi:hypothetical protein
MDDLGMETERLVGIKRLIYTEGIAGNISAWGKLDSSKRLDGFQHSFVMTAPGEVIAGKIWSSSDGTGRRIYPMMVVAQCAGCELGWVMTFVFPILGELQKQYQAVTTADEVRALTDEARDRLRGLARRPQSTEPLYGNILTWLSQRPDMGKDQRGLLNLIYEAEEKLSIFRQGTSDGNRTVVKSGASYSIRVPACGQSSGDVLRLWLEFLYVWIDKATPILAITPEKEDWVDLIVGDAGPSDLYCIQASRKTIPFNTEIPYSLDGAFIARARRLIRGES